MPEIEILVFLCNIRQVQMHLETNLNHDMTTGVRLMKSLEFMQAGLA